MTTHEIKIWPQFFEAVLCGDKTFEYRENDRFYQRGDVVVLKEWDSTVCEFDTGYGYEKRARGFTGRKIEKEIGYVVPVSQTHVVFSLIEVKKNNGPTL